MCINRGWAFQLNPFGETNKGSNYYLTSKRSDGQYFTLPIFVDNEGKTDVRELIKSLELLESKRNCECPKNPNCHKEINGKLDIIIAKE